MAYESSNILMSSLAPIQECDAVSISSRSTEEQKSSRGDSGTGSTPSDWADELSKVEMKVGNQIQQMEEIFRRRCSVIEARIAQITVAAMESEQGTSNSKILQKGTQPTFNEISMGKESFLQLSQDLDKAKKRITVLEYQRTVGMDYVECELQKVRKFVEEQARQQLSTVTVAVENSFQCMKNVQQESQMRADTLSESMEHQFERVSNDLGKLLNFSGLKADFNTDSMDSTVASCDSTAASSESSCAEFERVYKAFQRGGKSNSSSCDASKRHEGECRSATPSRASGVAGVLTSKGRSGRSSSPENKQPLSSAFTPLGGAFATTCSLRPLQESRTQQTAPEEHRGGVIAEASAQMISPVASPVAQYRCVGMKPATPSSSPLVQYRTCDVPPISSSATHGASMTAQANSRLMCKTGTPLPRHSYMRSATPTERAKSAQCGFATPSVPLVAASASGRHSFGNATHSNGIVKNSWN